MKTTHIYWFAYFGLQEPSVRYRAHYALAAMHQQYGITYDLVLPSYRPKHILQFIKVYGSVMFNRKKDSVIVFEKIRTRRIYATALKVLLLLHKDRTIYDIDDADYIKFAPHTIRYFIKHCEGCTVGSSALAEYCLQLNKDVCILTSPVVAHGHVKGRRNERLTIGWIGYYNAHRASLLALLFPALASLDTALNLVIMGINKPEQIRELQAFFAPYKHIHLVLPQHIDWLNESEVYRTIATFDIGVAPLLPTEVNQAKSAFKLKQYLCCGVPVLGSPVGENSTFLQHGFNGFMCFDAQEFAQNIKLIANMTQDAYSTLSANALGTQRKFDMSHYCHTLKEYLDR